MSMLSEAVWIDSTGLSVRFSSGEQARPLNDLSCLADCPVVGRHEVEATTNARTLSTLTH